MSRKLQIPKKEVLSINLFSLFSELIQKFPKIIERKFVTSASILMVVLFSLMPWQIFGAVGVASVSGNWSSTATWGGSAIPVAGTAVTINEGITVTVDINNAVCTSLRIGTNTATTAAILLFNSGSQLTVGGTVSLGSSSGNRPGTITMTSGGTLICNGFALSGTGTKTFTSGTGTVQLAATNTIPATPFNNFNNLTISAGTTTLGAATSISGNLAVTGGTLADGGFLVSGPGTGAGTFTISGIGVFTMSNTTITTGSYQAGSFPIFQTYAFASGSTVNYNGAAAQPLYAIASPGYGNVTITTAAATSTKTANGPFVIQGALTVANATSVFYYGSNTVTVNGNIVNLGVINGASGSPGTGEILITGGSGARTLTTTGTSITATYGNLEFNDATDATTISNASGTAGTTNVTGYLTITSGTVNIGSFTTAFSVSGATSVTGTLTINNAILLLLFRS